MVARYGPRTSCQRWVFKNDLLIKILKPTKLSLLRALCSVICFWQRCTLSKRQLSPTGRRFLMFSNDHIHVTVARDDPSRREIPLSSRQTRSLVRQRFSSLLKTNQVYPLACTTRRRWSIAKLSRDESTPPSSLTDVFINGQLPLRYRIPSCRGTIEGSWLRTRVYLVARQRDRVKQPRREMLAIRQDDSEGRRKRREWKTVGREWAKKKRGFFERDPVFSKWLMSRVSSDMGRCLPFLVHSPLLQLPSSSIRKEGRRGLLVRFRLGWRDVAMKPLGDERNSWKL